MAGVLREFAEVRPAQPGRRLLRHHAGAHRRDRLPCAGLPPRAMPAGAGRRSCSRRMSALPARRPRNTRLSGLEPLVITALEPPDHPGTSSTSASAPTSPAARSSEADLEGRYDEAVEVARQQVENGAQVLDVNMDEGMLDSEKAMVDAYLNLIAAEPDIARIPVMVDSSKWSVIEAGLKCLQGKGIVNSISMKEGEAAFLARRAWCALRRGGGGDGLRRVGQADTCERKVEICTRAYRC
jgi:5-methyltetrahydrofolate--homocysteine methyltransferase